MNESQHLSSQFDEELGRLRTHVLQMGGMVETQVSSAIEAYSSGEVASVKSIVEADRKINDLEKAIDDDCAHVIAKRQPTASDLRLVLGISKIVTDLERAGDEAKKIAKGVRRIYEAGHLPAQYGIAAVDTDVIPLGTRLYIPGYGEAIAADTGGAIVGDRIDLCMESYSEAMAFGRRDVTVYVLN